MTYDVEILRKYVIEVNEIWRVDADSEEEAKQNWDEGECVYDNDSDSYEDSNNIINVKEVKYEE